MKIQPTLTSVKQLGRTYEYQGAIWCALSATGIEFEVTATNCHLLLLGDNMIGEEGHRARFAIYVDDVLVVDDVVREAKKRVTAFEGVEEKKRIVRIIKLSESRDSTFGIAEIETDATKILPTMEKPWKIEYIGDSITCGYGVEGTLENVYSTENENTSKAYAYLSAKELDADYSLVSFSGYGIVSGYTDNGVRDVASLVPPIYDKMGESYGKYAGELEVKETAWDFSRFVPDIVVINLGTNDSSYCGTDSERCNQFKELYIEFLQTVRTKNPKAIIVATLGIMGDVMYPSIEAAVKEYQQKTGDGRVYVRHFNDQDFERNGYGVDYHPNEISQATAAKEMVSILKEMKEKLVFQYEALDASWVDTSKKLVAFAFDDGPIPYEENSAAMRILRALEKHGQHGTFFYVGNQINESTKCEIEYAMKIGCEVGNHTWTHPDLTKLPAEEMKEEIEKTRALLSDITGMKRFALRFPYLSYNEQVLQIMNVPGVSCRVDSGDWNHGTYESVVKRILDAEEEGILDGAILLMHENYEFTAQAVEYLVPYLLEHGYQIVSVAELAALKNVELKVGKPYFCFE